MRLLAVETTSLIGSLAILDGPNILFEKSWGRDRARGEQLIPEIENALKSAKTSLKEIDRFAVGIGPGSFTGIRVGLNAVKALAYTLQKKIVGVCSLEILARQVKSDESMPVLALINAYGNSVFVASYAYENGSFVARLKPSCQKIDAIQKMLDRPHVCVGSGFEVVTSSVSPPKRNFLVRDIALSDAPLALTLGLAVQNSDYGDSTFEWNQIEPLYIKVSGAEEKLGK